MADRKVLNKYYPPDYDPSSIPRIRQPKQRQIQSRIMLPMSVQCTQCGEFVYKGKKFNARKELLVGEEYLGVKRWRFYFRCPSCLQEMTFKTDPQHGGYEVEMGARRNVEPWRDRKRDEDEQRKEREREEAGDVMKQLENKSKEGRREHELAEVLEELRERNGRGQQLTSGEVVDWHVRRKERQEGEEDERKAKEAFSRRIQHNRDSHIQSGVQRELAHGSKWTIDALDFEVEAEDGGVDDSKASTAKEGVDERAEEDGQEEEGDEAGLWTRQRRELTANGLSFGSLASDQPTTQHAAAPAVDEKKEGLASSAAIVVVRKRKAEQSHKDGVVDSGVDKKQRGDEERAELSVAMNTASTVKPAAVALSSLLSEYDDDNDSDTG